MTLEGELGGQFTDFIPVYIQCSELDPHGATGNGNPIGGNVTSNITGQDQHFAEWMVSLHRITSFTLILTHFISLALYCEISLSYIKCRGHIDMPL